MKKQFSQLVFLAIFCGSAMFAQAGEITLVFENDRGFWGFDKTTEEHNDGVVTLRCSEQGFIKPEFVVKPQNLNISRKKLNRFVNKLSKKIKKSDKSAGEFNRNGLTAKWQTLENGHVKIVVSD